MSDSVRPHRRQPTRLHRPWDSPGKNTGVGCHFLLQCMKLKSESEVTQSCPMPSDPMHHKPTRLLRPWDFPGKSTGVGCHCQASLSITNSQSLLKPMSIESVMPSNYLILCRPLLFLPSIFPSIRVFSNESTLRIRRSKYWSFSFNISPSNEHSGLVGSPCSPRDSQESSPTPQFKSINSSVLGFLYSPTLTSIHDHRKNHSLD